METVNDPGWTFHLLPEALTALDVKPRAVLHVGAHHGEEVPIYLACGFETITLVEADPANCLLMRGQDWAPQVRIYGVACGSEAAAAAPFYRNESTPFSSLTPNLRRGPVSTIEVPVVRTADVQDDANVLVIDTQGTEMDVLRAANPDRLELVIVEVQTLSPTAHGAYLPDLLTWANEHGWAPRIQWRRERRWSDMLLTPVAAT